MSLQPGDPLPDFILPTDGGGTVSAADLAGRKAVIYFYPKDDTSGCTKEAQAFRDAAEAFAAAGVTIIGISPDTVASHDKFKAKHGLTFTLAADEDKSVAQAFGVWVEKSMYGKSYMGVDRSTFLIGPSGRIERIWRKVKVPGHVEEVLAAAKAL
jgi:peroxiredoxin Q/BCP